MRETGVRSLVVTLLVFATLPFILAKPHIGIYVWSWLGYMNPHRLAWGFAYDFPFAQIVAVVTLLALFFSKVPKQIPWTRETVLLLAFIVWMLFTTFFAVIPDAAWAKWDKVWKVQLFVFLTLVLITDRERLQLLIWVIALSLAFYGVKGGIFTLKTGGAHLVLGPQGSFIGARGEIGTALNMTIPLLRYLQLSAQNMWVRHGLTAAMVLTCFAAIGTHSRGAFLGMIAVVFFLILKSRRKIILSVLLMATAYGIVSFMPSEWSERMHTIETYEEDASAMGRIDAWRYAIAVANASPIVGGGFEITAGRRAAHSVYFQLLGEHGYVGLGLFLLLMGMTWQSASWIRRMAKRSPEIQWTGDLAAMIQVSIVGYAVGGAFISQAYFDLFYHLVAVIIVCKVLVLKHVNEQGPARAAAGGRVSAGEAVAPSHTVLGSDRARDA